MTRTDVPFRRQRRGLHNPCICCEGGIRISCNRGSIMNRDTYNASPLSLSSSYPPDMTRLKQPSCSRPYMPAMTLGWTAQRDTNNLRGRGRAWASVG